jgi:succinate dehydrogenase/fumarate reductase flavoprotein subunit
MSAAQGILDPSVVGAVGEESFQIIQELKSWGVKFPQDKEGKFITFKQWAARESSSAVTSISIEGDLKLILFQELKKRRIKILEHSPVTSILTCDGQVAGLCALDLRSGDFIVIPAKTIILAAGSAARFGFPETGILHAVFDCPACAGDSYSLAYRAGAHLINMECLKHYISVRYFNGPALAPLSHGGKLVNAMGKDLLVKGPVATLELNNFMDLFSIILRENQEGRGPVYIDTRHLSLEVIAELERCFFTTERPTFKKFFEKKGIKLGRDLIEIGLSEAALCGGHGINGVRINNKAETNILGLYAAGDAAANATSLMGAFALGRIAGREAAIKSTDLGAGRLNSEIIAKEKKRVFGPLKRLEGITPALLERKLRLIVNNYVASPKSEGKLKTAQILLRHLRKDINLLKARDFHEAMKALEVQTILDCAEMATAASLFRRESRWGIYHYRADFPQRNDKEWKKFIIVKLGESGFPEVFTEAIQGE